MKPLERIFFQACMLNGRYFTGTMLHDGGISVREIINAFCSIGFPVKQLWYYLKKWGERRFYDYGVTEDLGWFYPDNFTGEYKVIYENVVKERKRNGDT